MSFYNRQNGFPVNDAVMLPLGHVLVGHHQQHGLTGEIADGVVDNGAMSVEINQCCHRCSLYPPIGLEGAIPWLVDGARVSSDKYEH